MDQTSEARELEYELTIDASTDAQTDHVQKIASHAAAAALAAHESGEYGDLLLNTGRAALIATNAVLRALDEAGLLIPEGETVQRWVVMSHDNRPLTLPLDAEQLREHMTTVGLSDTDRVDTIRTVVSTIPREATRAHPDLRPVPAGEADF